MTNTFDALVVPGEEFAVILRELIDHQDKKRLDYLAGGDSRTSRQPNGGRKWVADMVGVEPRRVGLIMEQRFVTLRIVDEWLIKLGLQHLLDNGTLSVVPNPNMGIVNWIEWAEERGHCI